MTDTLKLARLWNRHIAQGIMLVSFAILGIYALMYFMSDSVPLSENLAVSDTAASLAASSFAIGAVSLLWNPKRYPTGPSLLAYTLLWCTIAVLIVSTGGVNSPFIALWVVTAIFAGLFGAFALLPMALAPAGYIAWLFINDTLDPSGVVAVILAGELPLVLSYLTWIARPSTVQGANRTYQQLASELSQVADKAEVVINAITDGVVALNNQGNIQLINPAAQQLIGWEKHDAISLNYKSVLKLTDAKGGELVAANDPVVRTLATNQEIRSNEFTLITNSGKKLLVSLVISPVGQPGSGIIVVFRDITKEKTEEKQQAEFISTASHEMRTPVAAIEGYLGLTLNPATAQIDTKAREYITKAHEAAQHLGRLFSDLLDVSKAEDGRLSSNPSVVDVVTFAHDIVQGLRPKAEAKGLHMIFKPRPDDKVEEITTRRLNPVFYANVDNDHLREVISNLVDNAIKYTPQGTVAIDVSGDEEHVVFSVEDSGIGIPSEDLPHLFQKFYRVDSSDTREIGGTGLGLYLCRRLAETMDGRIWVESQYKQGSTFFLEMPRISHEDAMRLIEVDGVKNAEPQIQPISTAPPPATMPVPPVPPVSAEQTVNVSPPADMIASQLTTIPTESPSLAAIEANPEQYLRHPGKVIVPPRDQNQP